MGARKCPDPCMQGSRLLGSGAPARRRRRVVDHDVCRAHARDAAVQLYAMDGPWDGQRLPAQAQRVHVRSDIAMKCEVAAQTSAVTECNGLSSVQYMAARSHHISLSKSPESCIKSFKDTYYVVQKFYSLIISTLY